jgi:hypothetical protein
MRSDWAAALALLSIACTSGEADAVYATLPLVQVATGAGAGAVDPRSPACPIRSLTVNVLDFGASGDGDTDDTTAIQAAIRAASDAGGGEVFVPPGRYRLATVDRNGDLLKPRSNVSLRGTGDASVLVAAAGLNGVGKSFKFIAQEPGDAAVDDFCVSDLVFDGNGVNNLVPASEPAKMNTAILIREGDAIHVERVTVRNVAGQQCLSFGSNSNPPTVTNLRVTGNLFDTVGRSVPGNTNQNDHSSIYAQAINAVISDNVFTNPATEFTTTALEVHSTNAIVTGNVVRNFGRVFNIVATVTDQGSSVYAGNVGTGLTMGASFWVNAGRTMSDVQLSGNYFELSSGVNDVIDLAAQVQAGASVSGITIEGNDVVNTDATLTHHADGVSIGRVADIVIRRNRFDGLLGAAVALGTLTAGQTAANIEGNTISNCGRSTAPGYNAALRFNGTNALRVLRVAGNTVRNPSMDSPAAYALTGNVPITSGVVLDNDFVNFSAPVSLSGTYTTP